MRVVSFAFAENYLFAIQNGTEMLHWNNDQATILTIVIYYSENDELKHKSIPSGPGW